MTTPCEALAERVGLLFTCSELGQYTRIRTPYLYPDGDIIDIFLRESAGEILLTDLGETLGWLGMQTPSLKRTKKQRQLIMDACQTHGVELFRGSLSMRFPPKADLAEAVVRFAQAALRVSDVWFTLRNQSFETIVDEVEELLIDRRIEYVRSEKIEGRSTRTYTIDFHTFAARHSSLVTVLSTSNRTATRRLTAFISSQWHDLSHLAAGTSPLRFISLFDDTSDVWGEDDFRLLEDMSTISLWSRPDEFINRLTA